ncbi:hypothetical protein [Sandarakinorhabdus rubra]|uniref:hypothetical protein n=1 Tax=Sandarakinorhabdus rubra TaxID=2672568 RepID=UPI0013D92512|nr:hypothetical protein [Sandarakinorhabdus rubra]
MRPLSILQLAALALALSIAGPHTAASAAGYVNNGETWLAMPPVARQGYAQGINDAANQIYPTDDVGAAAVKLGRTRCLIDQKTTSAILADRITMAYTNEPAFKNLPPTIVYFAKMSQFCREHIARERERMGLPPG